MAIRSRYRDLAKKPAEEIAPSAKININSEPEADAVAAPREAIAEAARPSDEATLRLQKQIEELKRSEELQRRHMAVAQQRDQAIGFWRQNGVPEPQLRLLLATPGALDQLTDLAGNEAVRRGFQYGTAGHTEAAVKIFRDRLNTLEEQVVSNASAQPTPHEPPPLRPAPPPPSPPEPDRAAIMSAPVSRGDVGGYSRNPSPSSVRLTLEQREAAALAGISEVEYARQFAKLDRYKRERGDERP
jgi:hypothetical protein